MVVEGGTKVMGKTATVSQTGGEAPLEKDPSRKHLVEDFTPLTNSVMWKLLANYYKKMALEAWSHNYVPMFVTCNSKFARDYAKAVLSFLMDWYRLPTTDPSVPAYILEVGGGHGRFTYLFLRHILRTQPCWKACGLPEKPFVYVFSDVAEANVAFCRQHKAMQEFIESGWLDFSLFDANQTTDHSRDIQLQYRNAPLPRDAPLIVIGNYVLDSLLTDGIKITSSTPGQTPTTCLSRSTLAIYSPQPEPDPTDPDIISRMTIAWDWQPICLPEAWLEPTVGEKESGLLQFMDAPVSEIEYVNHLARAAPVQTSLSQSLKNTYVNDNNEKPIPDYMLQNERIRSVLRYYVRQSLTNPSFSTMSFVYPVGAFMLFDYLYDYSGGKLMTLIGDKGYKDFDEFRGQRNPHIAIHGSISFMVNLHSIKLFFEALGGFFACTPYKDTFQVTLCYAFSSVPASAFGHSLCRLIEGFEDLSPDGEITWQRLLQDTRPPKSLELKGILCLLRYSGHDPEVFYNFRQELTSQSVGVILGCRGEADLQKDIERVYENWYKLRPGEDVPDVLAHLSMKIGRLDRAIYYFEKSLTWCPESRHPASYVNLAACQKALGQLEKAKETLQHALAENPTFQPALDLETQIFMSEMKTAVAFIGCGEWTREECLPQLLRDSRVSCKAVFSFQTTQAEELLSQIQRHGHDSCVIYKGAGGLEELLSRSDIAACVVDVHPGVFKSLSIRIWAAGKHVLSSGPIGLTGNEAHETVQQYLQTDGTPSHGRKKVAWHVYSRYRAEEAFEEAVSIINSGSLGTPLSGTYHFANDLALSKSHAGISSLDQLAFDLLNGVTGLSMLLNSNLTSLCVAPGHDTSGESKMACISAWLKFRSKLESVNGPEIVATAFCSRSVGDVLESFNLEFTHGTLKLTLVPSGWKLLATPHNGSVPIDKAFSLSNISSVCDSWFVQMLCYQKAAETVPSTAEVSPTSSVEALAATTVHCSVASAMCDSANLEAIQLSLQGKGAIMLLGGPPAK